jgi:hypothetical protein
MKDDFSIHLVVNAYANVETKLMTSHESRRFFTNVSACCFLTTMILSQLSSSSSQPAWLVELRS